MKVGKYIQPIHFPHHLYVVYNFDEKKFNKLFHFKDHEPLLKEEVENYTGSTLFGLYDKDNNPCIVVIITNEKDLVDTCAHEALHVVRKIFSLSEIDLNEGSNEAYAYFIGWVA